MEETETQRNWNNYFKKNEPPKKHNIFIPTLILLLAFVAAIIYNYSYRNTHKKLNETQTTKETILNTTSEKEIYADNYEKDTLISSDFIIDEKNIIDKYGIPSNQRGITMANSIKKISGIFNNIDNKTIDELYNFLTEIYNVDLSSHYNTFKQSMVIKLNYWIEYKRDKNPDSIKKYNSISYTEELSKAFDAAGVRYEIDENNILTYWYTEN